MYPDDEINEIVIAPSNDVIIKLKLKRFPEKNSARNTIALLYH